MNTQRLIPFAAVLGFAAATVLFNPSGLVAEAQAEEVSMEQWEYLATKRSITSEATQQKLNTLGTEGWELVTVAGETGHLMMLKRRVR